MNSIWTDAIVEESNLSQTCITCEKLSESVATETVY